MTCPLWLLATGLLGRVCVTGILIQRTLAFPKASLKLCLLSNRYLFTLRPALQGAKVLRHDQPLLNTLRRVLHHRFPVRYEDKRLVEHLLRRFSAFSELYPAHNSDEDRHLVAVLLLSRVVEDVFGRAHCEIWVEDVCVKRFDLIVRVFALRFEKFGVVGWCWEDGTVDGDVCADGVSLGGVDVEWKDVVLSVDGLVIVVGKDFSS
jgi:hypothetical protein